jgi:hypothetical protein
VTPAGPFRRRSRFGAVLLVLLWAIVAAEFARAWSTVDVVIASAWGVAVSLYTVAWWCRAD